jgi:hypothetical protein
MRQTIKEIFGDEIIKKIFKTAMRKFQKVGCRNCFLILVILRVLLSGFMKAFIFVMGLLIYHIYNIYSTYQKTKQAIIE